VEIPPDVKKMGVIHSGVATPVVSNVTPAVVLPISDKQILSGLHSNITTAARWLAVWCIRKLQKAHVALKLIHGKIIRVED
jgi:hypothetical protein